MNAIYISHAISTAPYLEDVVKIINQGKICEGMEGIEFTADQMAGQYAAYAAYDNDQFDDESLSAHLEILREAGAKFDDEQALQWGGKIAQALQDNE